MSQVMMLSSLVRTCVIKSLSVRTRRVDERTGGGGAEAKGGTGAVGAVAIDTLDEILI